jgi:Fis family transcriptional regulator
VLNLVEELNNNNHSLQKSVQSALTKYLKDLDGEEPTNLYDKIMTEIEKPLLSTIMNHCQNNQSRAASCLGINRGTLRKKLKQYQISH